MGILESLVERRIREAMERGDLDNLPGAGKPIPDLDENEDELAWVKRWMKREGIDLGRELKDLTPEQRTRLVNDLRGR
jgi:Domain of unknown function (DUF1992)